MSVPGWVPPPAEAWAYHRGRVFGGATWWEIVRGRRTRDAELELLREASHMTGRDLLPVYVLGRLHGSRWVLLWQLAWVPVQVLCVVAGQPWLVWQALSFTLVPSVLSTAAAAALFRRTSRGLEPGPPLG